ncbi:MAG: phosphate ABC transporter permease subunit PstC [Syntrophorhabdaceae bacterium]|nr:phosphate ABC transporter permease subunit PstC [Syntrophorhabdaceae bacterium]
MPKKVSKNPKDRAFEALSAFFAAMVLTLGLLLLLVLLYESLPALRKFGAGFIVSQAWNPVEKEFGALSFIYGTVITSFLAILLAVPLSVGAAIFINDFAPQWLKKPVSLLAELLAAIPSVIYGLWGIFVLVPMLRSAFMKPMAKYFGWWIPLFKGPVYGPSVLAASVLLSIMIVPFILSVSREVLATVPVRQKEAVLAIGGTRWEMIRIVVGQHCIPGIFGATVLGLGRALGETMAVTMVIGNRPDIFYSLFHQGYSMAAVIANEFAEAADLQLSSLILIGLLLFILTFLVNLAAKWILSNLVKNTSLRN